MLYAGRLSKVTNIALCAAMLVGLPALAASDQVPITFEETEIGATVDPNGLFSDEEIVEGGSDVQPSILHSEFPVDGGKVELSILADKWCGTQECPFRFRLTTDSGMVLSSDESPAYGMICQDVDAMSVDPVELTIEACGNTIDLKRAR